MEAETHYAKSRGIRIAYQVMGAGPDLVIVPGQTSHLEIQWREKTLRDRGVAVSPISDQPWGSVLVFRDPDNIQLELCAPPAA